MNPAKALASSTLAVLVALYIVGAVSNGVIRHAVQTLPLWFSIIMAFRRQEAAKWAALPCLAIWLALMTVIWAFLLGWTDAISGKFTPVEVALTIVIGVACLVGLAASFRWRTNSSWRKGLLVTAIFAAIQITALRISFLPSIATDR